MFACVCDLLLSHNLDFSSLLLVVTIINIKGNYPSSIQLTQYVIAAQLIKIVYMCCTILKDKELVTLALRSAVESDFA